jgi:hypothetical protein
MYTTWVILLYYCINTSCYNVLLPTEYIAEKECMFYSTNIVETYKSINNLASDVQIRVRCRDSSLLWIDIYPI